MTVAHTADAAVDEGDLLTASLRLQQVAAAEQLRDAAGEAMANRPAAACLGLAKGLIGIVAVQAPVSLSEALLALGAPHQVAAAGGTAHVVGLRFYLRNPIRERSRRN